MTTPTLDHINGLTVLTCSADGPTIASASDALDVVGLAYGRGADVVVMPAAALTDAFFDLSTGVAGEITQKIMTYVPQLVIVGDISGHLARSEALRAYVREANRGRQLWFVDRYEDLVARLSTPSAVSGGVDRRS